MLAFAGCGGEGPGRRCERLVALAPSSVELLFELGLGDALVGVGDYCTFPPAAAAKPKLGGLYDPNLESILALRPDTAVLLRSETELAEKLRRLGVNVLTVPADTVADLELAIDALAEHCGVHDRGEALRARLAAGLAARGSAKNGKPPRVLLSLSREPGRVADVLAAGPGTFYDELLTRAGAVNVLAGAGRAYPMVGLESLLAGAPEVIVELQAAPVSPERREALLADWRRFPEIPAVADGRVVVVGGDYTMIPGPRLPRLYQELLAALAQPRAGDP